MRCPECDKLANVVLGVPEIIMDELDGDGTVRVVARARLECADCGTELKEARFELEGIVPVGSHRHELSLETEAESTEWRSHAVGAVLYGISVKATVSCSCGETVGSTTLTGEMPSDEMEELK